MHLLDNISNENFVWKVEKDDRRVRKLQPKAVYLYLPPTESKRTEGGEWESTGKIATDEESIAKGFGPRDSVFWLLTGFEVAT